MKQSIYRPTLQSFAIYVLPGTLVFAFSTMIPILITLFTSLHSWHGGPTLSFVGLDNWHRVISDRLFWNAFRRNLTLVMIAVSGQVGLGFMLAMLFSGKKLRFGEFYRTVLFVPVVLAPVVVGFLWTIMYNRQVGLVNIALRTASLDVLVQDWLGNPRFVLYSIGIAKVWQFVGLHLMIILAGIQGISHEVIESAEIDGAGPVRRAIHIILPLIRNTLVVSAMISIATNMKEFDHVFAMTGGGRGEAQPFSHSTRINNPSSD